MVYYILNLWEKLEATGSLTRENRLRAQNTQEAVYNKEACLQVLEIKFSYYFSAESKLLAH